MKTAEIEDRFAQGFAGNCSRVYADAAHGLLALEDGDFPAELGGADCAFLAGGTTANHDQIVLVRFHGLPPEFRIKHSLSGVSAGFSGALILRGCIPGRTLAADLPG